MNNGLKGKKLQAFEPSSPEQFQTTRNKRSHKTALATETGN